MNLGIEFRPLRVGMLVRAGNLDDLVAAGGLNTMLAGGISNPLIPISDDKAFDDTVNSTVASESERERIRMKALGAETIRF